MVHMARSPSYLRSDTAHMTNANETQCNPVIDQTDGWVVVSVTLLIASLTWTILMFIAALTGDRCDEYAQCLLSLQIYILWFYPHIIAAIPIAIALLILVRRYMQGERHMVAVGLATFGANVVLSAVLLFYLSTLPMEFR
jgi:hypothetical protein